MTNKKEKSKVVKSVAFSNNDQMERQLLEYALKQGSFSTYIKRLIQRDMEHGHKVMYNASEKERLEKLEKENEDLKSKIEQIKNLVSDL
jgi:predicted CopG family antitoxin